MAKLTSKSQLNVGTEIVIDEPAKTIRLVAAGNLVAKDGVTMQAIYSKCVDLWATPTYQDSPFPLYGVDNLSGQYQIGTDGSSPNGWAWYDDTTRNMIRDAGWSEYNAAGVETAQYCGFVGLGTITPATTVQPYYHLAAADSPTDFPFTDQFNIGVKVKDNVSLDKRTYAKCFVREYGKKFKSSVLADTGSSGTGPFKQSFLVSNEDDLKITTLLGSDKTAGDAAMAGAPYSGITVAYYSTPVQKDLNNVSDNFLFSVVVNGNNATLEQIYAKVQYLLRQGTSINTGGDAGSKIGKIQSELMSFVGDTLVCAQGVFIDNVAAADKNRVEFFDNGGTKRTYTYYAAGTLEFNSALIGAGSSYRLMFATGPGAGDDYGESGAVTVKDAYGVDLAGTISGTSVSFEFDWDSDTYGGTAGTNKNVVLIGIRPGYGKFAVGTGTLYRSKANKIAIVAEQDRVYSAV